MPDRPVPTSCQSAADRGNLDDVLAGVLSTFGLQPTAVQQNVDDTIAAVLTDRGHRNVDVVGLRYATLTLAASAAAAQLLRLDRDQLLAALQERVGADTVVAIKISSRRGGRLGTRTVGQPAETSDSPSGPF